MLGIAIDSHGTSERESANDNCRTSLRGVTDETSSSTSTTSEKLLSSHRVLLGIAADARRHEVRRDVMASARERGHMLDLPLIGESDATIKAPAAAPQ